MHERNYSNYYLETNIISSYVGYESECYLAECHWFCVSHEIAVKLLAWTTVSSVGLSVGESSSRLTHVGLSTGLHHDMAAGFLQSKPYEIESV